MIQALAHVTGRGWVQKSRDKQVPSDDARVEGSDSEIAERLASGDEDDSEAEYQFDEGDN